MLDTFVEIIDLAFANRRQGFWIIRLMRVGLLSALAVPDLIDAAQFLSAVFGLVPTETP